MRRLGAARLGRRGSARRWNGSAHRGVRYGYRPVTTASSSFARAGGHAVDHSRPPFVAGGSAPARSGLVRHPLAPRQPGRPERHQDHDTRRHEPPHVKETASMTRTGHASRAPTPAHRHRLPRARGNLEHQPGGSVRCRRARHHGPRVERARGRGPEQPDERRTPYARRRRPDAARRVAAPRDGPARRLRRRQRHRWQARGVPRQRAERLEVGLEGRGSRHGRPPRARRARSQPSPRT